jgi:hypothetical protein
MDSVYTTVADAYNNIVGNVAKVVEGAAPAGVVIAANGLCGLCYFAAAAASLLSAGGDVVVTLALGASKQLEPFTEQKKLRC